MDIALSRPLQVPAPRPPRRFSGRRRRGAIPGFGLTLGLTLGWLGVIVLIPLAALFARSAGIGWEGFAAAAFSDRAIAAYRVSVLTALAAAGVNAVFGLLLAWVFVRYEFPGKRLFDATIDLPFALPTAVAGIALTTLYAQSGWIGRLTDPLHIHIAFTQAGIVVAMAFVGSPFVVRTVQPVLEDLDYAMEEAARSLGASPWQTFVRVLFPTCVPALLTGTALAFARAAGEYGSVIFIAGNMPMKTEIAALLIVTRLEEYDYEGAAAIALAMLVFSLSIMLAINLLQNRMERREDKRA